MSALSGSILGYKKDGSQQQKQERFVCGTSAIAATLQTRRQTLAVELLASGMYSVYVDDVEVYTGSIRR